MLISHRFLYVYQTEYMDTYWNSPTWNKINVKNTLPLTNQKKQSRRTQVVIVYT